MGPNETADQAGRLSRPPRRPLRVGPCASAPARRPLRVGPCASAPARRPLRVGPCASAPARRSLRVGPCASVPARRSLRVGPRSLQERCRRLAGNQNQPRRECSTRRSWRIIAWSRRLSAAVRPLSSTAGRHRQPNLRARSIPAHPVPVGCFPNICPDWSASLLGECRKQSGY